MVSRSERTTVVAACCDDTSSDDDDHNTSNAFLLLCADALIALVLLARLSDVGSPSAAIFALDVFTHYRPAGWSRR